MRSAKVFSVILTLFVSDVIGMMPMPFRIGFEGQMEGQLCMQALNRPAIQKKPIFEMRYQGKKLWHVEFDGPDLEFVTVPFTCNEREQIQRCMLTIQLALNDLVSLLPNDSISSIDEWFTSLRVCSEGEKVVSDPTFFQTQNLGTIQIKKIFANWKPVWRPQVTLQHPLCCTVALYTSLFDKTKSLEEIKKVIPENIQSNTALGGLVFLQAHEMPSMANSVSLAIKDVKSNTVLVMALTRYFIEKGIPEERINLEEILRVVGCPEIVEITSKYYNDALSLYKNAVNLKLLLSLKVPLPEVKKLQSDPVLIHMLNDFYDSRCAFITDLICRARESEPIIQNILFMMHTWQSFNTVNQFDAKRFTLFMSRRPMCHMLAEIATASREIPFLTDNFSKKALFERKFTDIFCSSIPSCLKNLQEIWHMSNFGEQFYDIGNNPINLTELIDFFPASYKEQAKLLLRDGIISTTMLRVMDLKALKDAKKITLVAEEIVGSMKNPRYFFDALESVQTPKEKNFLKIVKTDKITLETEELPQAIDLLSPPFPLDMHDAMGFYRNGLFSEKTALFGGAIIELRNISDLQRIRKDPEVKFLTISSNASIELLNLFDFLKELKIEVAV